MIENADVRKGGQKILKTCRVPESVVPEPTSMQTFVNPVATRAVILFKDLFLSFGFRRHARVPVKTGQEQARSVTFVAGTRERGGSYLGNLEERQGSHLSLQCLHHAPCRVRMQAKK